MCSITVAKKAAPQPIATYLKFFMLIINRPESVGSESNSVVIKRLIAVTASHRLMSSRLSVNAKLFTSNYLIFSLNCRIFRGIFYFGNCYRFS